MQLSYTNHNRGLLGDDKLNSNTNYDYILAGLLEYSLSPLSQKMRKMKKNNQQSRTSKYTPEYDGMFQALADMYICCRLKVN